MRSWRESSPGIMLGEGAAEGGGTGVAAGGVAAGEVEFEVGLEAAEMGGED